MDHYSVAQAKARLSEILDKVESGRDIVITRRGAAVARIVGAERRKQPLDFASIDRFRNSLPMQKEGAADLIRRMRDKGY